ncbi:MAG: DUF2202 domain-containing protein [Chloroflexi bacterium]|nr:DUF2202 domain-containing protein [Chloroflexota bacterium]
MFVKTSLAVLVIAGSLLAAVPAADAKGPIRARGRRGNAVTTVPAARPAGSNLVFGQVSDAERDQLLYLAQEEKLAQDLYVEFAKAWDVPIFARIASSELTHAAASARALEALGLTNPSADLPAGQFADPDLQALYDSLLAKGLESLTAALEVGVTIEETDIADLTAAAEASSDAGLTQLYANLARGSSNHLRAFSRQLDAAN